MPKLKRLTAYIYEEENVLPFAVSNANESNPDLIFEMSKHIDILFAGQKKSNNSFYNQLMGDINTIAYEARNLDSNSTPAQYYVNLKVYEYRFFET